MRLIFVNGTFDILHPGHRALLKFARQQGDKLLVAIDSDDRIKKLKGIERPIFTQEERSQHLVDLRYVDLVAIFHDDYELEKLIRDTKPAAMVIGAEYKGKKIIGADLIPEIIYFAQRLDSTTNIINRIIKNHNHATQTNP